MKIVFYSIAIALVCFVAQLFLPWWYAALVCFMGGFFIKRLGIAFVSGLALGWLWLIAALCLDHANHSLLSQKINLLLPANALLLTILTGCLVGGAACASGAAVKQLITQWRLSKD